jgi:hypothetical protein
MECREPQGVVRQRGKSAAREREEEGLEKKTGTEKEKKLAGLAGLVLLGNVLGFSRRGQRVREKGTREGPKRMDQRDGDCRETSVIHHDS